MTRSLKSNKKSLGSNWDSIPISTSHVDILKLEFSGGLWEMLLTYPMSK